MRSKVDVVSLGQGQTALAAKLINEGRLRGHWVLLQNCHLALSWMEELQRIVEAIEPLGTAKDFRLWLTSGSTPQFPVSILQSGLKLTNDPPTSLKQNVKGVYGQLCEEALVMTPRPDVFQRLLFGELPLCMRCLSAGVMHMCVCRRRHVSRCCSGAPTLRPSGLECAIRVQ